DGARGHDYEAAWRSAVAWRRHAFADHDPSLGAAAHAGGGREAPRLWGVREGPEGRGAAGVPQGGVALSLRQPLEGRQAVGNLMERLLVDRVDRHLRAAEQAGIIWLADLQDHGVQARPPRQDVRAAFGAKFPRHRVVEIAALELLGRAFGVAEAVGRHQHEHVGRTARDVLALAAMTLRLQRGLALGDIAQRAAVTSAFQLHGVLPVLPLS